MTFTFTKQELLALMEEGVSMGRQQSAIDETEIACRVLHRTLSEQRNSLPYQPRFNGERA